MVCVALRYLRFFLAAPCCSPPVFPPPDESLETSPLSVGRFFSAADVAGRADAEVEAADTPSGAASDSSPASSSPSQSIASAVVASRDASAGVDASEDEDMGGRSRRARWRSRTKCQVTSAWSASSRFLRLFCTSFIACLLFDKLRNPGRHQNVRFAHLSKSHFRPAPSKHRERDWTASKRLSVVT